VLRLADSAIDCRLAGFDRRQQVVQSGKRGTRIRRPRGRGGLFAFGKIHEHHACISAGISVAASLEARG
jgi:hypothetical protein